MNCSKGLKQINSLALYYCKSLNREMTPALSLSFQALLDQQPKNISLTPRPSLFKFPNILQVSLLTHILPHLLSPSSLIPPHVCLCVAAFVCMYVCECVLCTVQFEFPLLYILQQMCTFLLNLTYTFSSHMSSFCTMCPTSIWQGKPFR